MDLLLFFKQKTAYEWRISDWSSDVCSSDLGELCAGAEEPMAETSDFVSRQGTSGLNVRIRPSGIVPVGSVRVIRLRPLPRPCGACPPRLSPAGKRPCSPACTGPRRG